MIFTPDRRARAGLAVALVLPFLLGTGSPGRAGPGLAENLVHDAHVALARGDGIAAEMALRKALAAGLSRDAAAARMGEAYLDQGDLAKAREWLAPARFSPAEAAHGWRMLGRLEMASRNFAAAGAAFDRALLLTPNDSRLWVDIARLRYLGDEQAFAATAADRAVQLDPANVRALEMRGLLVRDQYGLVAALPWFEAGLAQSPADLSLLGEYAATLGDLGRAQEMLATTRRMLEIDPGNARAYFLQAVLAARAGKVSLARGLMNRAGRGMDQVPAAMLLAGALELQAGNANVAADLLDRLAAQQPHNGWARLLLARALYAAGDLRQLLDRFSAEAGRPDASPYLLTLLGRAHEDLGERDLAAPLLDRAASAGASPLFAAPFAGSGEAGSAAAQIRQLIAEGRGNAAATSAAELAGRRPGSADLQLLLGDARLAGHDPAGAIEAYRRAAGVRLTDDLMLHIVAAYVQGTRPDDAQRLVESILAGKPRNRLALRLAAGFAARRGDWPRAAETLRYLAAAGGDRDARLQADLALALLRGGDKEGAKAVALRAYRLQRGASTATQAWAMALEAGSGDRTQARALLSKAGLIGGENPLLIESEIGISRRP